MSRFILASGSPRRRELLKAVGYDFDVIPSAVDETLPDGISPARAVELLSERKCGDVAERNPGSVVLGCDTVVVLDGRILGKPADEEDAFKMLRMLSGRVHSVFTGVCISCGGKKTVFNVETKVRFFDLTDELINAYISTGEPMDTAGAYGIQAFGAALVESINGDYFTVVGLPLARVMRALSEFGVESGLENHIMERKDDGHM